MTNKNISNGADTIIRARGIVKTYVSGEIENEVLHGIDLDIYRGQFVALIGKSGAGKSTLLHQLSLLDIPTAGNVTLDGIDTSTLTDKEQAAFRLKRLGYIFQDYALLPELSATENVLVPLLMMGYGRAEALEKAEDALARVGLSHRFDNTPGQLSGGEQQRVSIARAVANAPQILFADEPTANLDSETSELVVDVLKELHKGGQTIVMVTHEAEYSALTERVITLADGVIAEDRAQGEHHHGTTNKHHDARL